MSDASEGGPLEGEVALITGGSTGIGRASARSLAEAGSSIAVAARSEGKLREVVETIETEFGVDALAVPTDVSDSAAVAEMVESVEAEFGRLDTLVVNAGIARDHTIDDVTIEEYRTVMGVNVDGAFFTAHESLPLLRESNGNVVFIGSYAGNFPYPGNPVYGASKWWVRGFAHSLAGAVGPEGVAVTVINPSEVRTDFDFGPDDPTPYHERYDASEATEPAVIGDAVRFAATQEPPDAVVELDLYRRNKFETF